MTRIRPHIYLVTLDGQVTEAVCVTAENIDIVSNWCDGYVVETWVPDRPEFVDKTIEIPSGSRGRLTVQIGDIVMRDEFGEFVVLAGEAPIDERDTSDD